MIKYFILLMFVSLSFAENICNIVQKKHIKQTKIFFKVIDTLLDPQKNIIVYDKCLNNDCSEVFRYTFKVNTFRKKENIKPLLLSRIGVYDRNLSKFFKEIKSFSNYSIPYRKDFVRRDIEKLIHFEYILNKKTLVSKKLDTYYQANFLIRQDKQLIYFRWNDNGYELLKSFYFNKTLPIKPIFYNGKLTIPLSSYNIDFTFYNKAPKEKGLDEFIKNHSNIGVSIHNNKIVFFGNNEKNNKKENYELTIFNENINNFYVVSLKGKKGDIWKLKIVGLYPNKKYIYSLSLLSKSLLKSKYINYKFYLEEKEEK